MQTQQAPPPPPAADAPPACPSCGKPVEPAQPFCLECGRRIAHGYRRPADWRIPIALVAALVIALGVAAGFGITELTDRDEGPETITVRTDAGGATPADPGEATPTPGTPPPGAQPPAATAPAAPTPPATPPEPTRGRPSAWPPGEEAYTVVLLTTKDRSAADDAAAKAAAAGESAGVLDSADYQRFDPGSFVAFSGQFDTVEAATEKARQLGGDFPGAYARFIEPK